MTRFTIAFTFILICVLQAPFAGRAVTVPAGTSLWVRTLDPVSSSDKAGKCFAARLDANLVVNNRVVIPAGSKVYGCVESSRSAGRATFAMSLKEIVVNGRPLTIATGTYEESGLRSGRKTDGANAGAVFPDAFGGAATGAAGSAIGAAIGGPFAGAAISAAGAVIGPAVRATTGLIGRRKSIEAPVGALFEFRLTQPVYL